MEQPVIPDCETCWKKDSCPDAWEGHFCVEWQSHQPEERKPDPNDLWRTGEEVFF